ncbi:hypothetical protein ANAEL_03992 [Anaerolineales bacterium]|nr:hypothetical protein ANAEL_03992 [Anaerolineales bacterium]
MSLCGVLYSIALYNILYAPFMALYFHLHKWARNGTKTYIVPAREKLLDQYRKPATFHQRLPLLSDNYSLITDYCHFHPANTANRPHWKNVPAFSKPISFNHVTCSKRVALLS